MSVQVVYKNKAKSSNLGVIALFVDEKFRIKNTNGFLSKNEISYIEKTLKNKKNTKENIVSFNINEKTTVILISLKKDLKSFDVENLGAVFYNFIKKNSFKDLSIISQSVKSKPGKDFIGRFMHGLKLKSYEFNIYKSKKTKNIITINIIGKQSSTALKNKLKFKALEEGTFFTRDLVSEPGNILHPDEYAKRLIKLKKYGLKVTVYDKKKLKKLGLNALLGVGQGSIRGSYLVTIEWKGSKSKSKPLGFVGKGVCFDTGGISLKPAKFMEDMTYDMAGSAVVVGLMKNFAIRKAKINAIGVVGLVENMPGGNAQRPGDIVKSYSGKTIEVLNTDAEGRLILADALAYASKHYDPEYMLDFATLTGAIVITLGGIATGIMGNNEVLIENIKVSSENTGEHVWQLPLWDEYCDQVKSKVADLKNLGSPGQAGSIAGAAFLKAFVREDIPWVHFDIAGTASHVENRSYAQKDGASGQVIRLVLDLLGV